MSDRKTSTSLAHQLVGPRHREPTATPVHATGSRRRHGRLAGLGLAVALGLGLAACGGHGGHGDSYRAATSEQEACCEHLDGDARAQCLAQIVRVDDPAVAASDPNQATYRCIERNFTCDPASGHATPASAQAQYDCIADLGQ
ncbi:MAG: hypothetical protein H6708_10760 [Kofleriaceae bacterium]|nr:hypothetical protein [Kofleriaceae bacterium]